MKIQNESGRYTTIVEDTKWKWLSASHILASSSSRVPTKCKECRVLASEPCDAESVNRGIRPSVQIQ